MSKKLSAALNNAAQKGQISTRLLVTLELPANTARLVANDTADYTLDYDGQVYTAADIKFSDVTSSLDGTKEQLQLTVSNIWQEWAAYVANNGANFNGCDVTVKEVFTDYPDEQPIWKFHGVIAQTKMNAAQFIFTIERDNIDFDTQTPMMDYDPACQYTFKDNHCQYGGGATSCDKTLTSCKSLGNVCRFGGHPSIPRQMVKATSS